MADVRLRPMTLDDLPALTELLAAAEEVDRTGEHFSLADLQEEAANPELELAQDWCAATEDEVLVGAVQIVPRVAGTDQPVLHVAGVTRPSHRGRGIGTALLTAALNRCRAILATRSTADHAEVRIQGLTENAAQESLLADHGVLPHRWSFGMRAQVADAPAPDPLPAGLTLRRYTAADEEALRTAHNLAFLDHPGFLPWTPERWRHWVSGSSHFRPELTLLVVDVDDRIAAYVQTDEFEADTAATGRREAYVAKVGTLREHRGRGLASTLLRHCLAAYREAGYADAALDVDSVNPTGANRVYERAGFQVTTRWNDYQLVISR